METLPNSSKSLWLTLFIISALAFATGFELSTQDEQTRFLEMGSLAKNHLSYSLQLKDDMALIDWSKNLEKLAPVVVFQAKNPAGVLAKGGNQSLYVDSQDKGLFYHFPYQWVYHSDLTNNGNTVDFLIIFQDLRGPLFWGLCLWGTVWITGLTSVFLKPRKTKLISQPINIVESVPTKPVQQHPLAPIDSENMALVIDKDYMICQVTDKAAKALDMERHHLLNCHFLDLLPDPSVMKAIDESRETKLLKPFPSHPQLSVMITPTLEGTILYLEPAEEQKGPK